MATEKTRADLIAEALSHFGVPGAGQNISAEDYSFVDDRVDAVLEALSSQSIYNADPNAIPLDAYVALGVILADALDSRFGATNLLSTVDQSGTSKRDRAIATLRLITAARPSGSVLVVEYM